MGNSLRALGALVALAVVVLSVACGETTTSEGGIGGSGMTAGRVTGFGSVFVNGVEYDTSQATFTVNGAAATEEELAVGMVVTVEGSRDTQGKGAALRIRYDSELRGPLTANAVSTRGDGTLQALNHSIVVQTDTVFDPGTSGLAGPAELTAGTLIDVSGYADPGGTLYASRIAVAPASAQSVLRGSVANPTATTFQIGALVVEWPAAAALRAGEYVEVRGHPAADGSGHLVAVQVGPVEEGIRTIGGEGETIDIEGVITAGLSGDLFALAGRAVRVTGATRFEDGGAADLMTGALAEVEGRVTSGVLVAEKVELHAKGGERQVLKGTLSELPTNGRLTLFGQGIAVTPAALHRDRAHDIRRFGIGDLRPGDYVELTVFETGTVGWTATSVVREKADGEQDEIGGYVQAVDGTRITLVGVTVEVGALTGFSAAVGDFVEVEGSYSGGLFYAQEGDNKDQAGAASGGEQGDDDDEDSGGHH